MHTTERKQTPSFPLRHNPPTRLAKSKSFTVPEQEGDTSFFPGCVSEIVKKNAAWRPLLQ